MIYIEVTALWQFHSVIEYVHSNYGLRCSFGIGYEEKWDTLTRFKRFTTEKIYTHIFVEWEPDYMDIPPGDERINHQGNQYYKRWYCGAEKDYTFLKEGDILMDYYTFLLDNALTKLEKKLL